MINEWPWFGSETIPRYEKAVDLVKKCNDVDEENASCTIKGSGKEAYHVTIHSCDCADFKLNMSRGFETPCKHMLALGIRLGLVPYPRHHEFFKFLRTLPIMEHKEIIDIIERVSFGESFDIDGLPDLTPVLYVKDGQYIFTESANYYFMLAKTDFENRLTDIIRNNIDNENLLSFLSSLER